MSPRTFHPFPKLPYEVRLLIWEASCFDRNKTTRHGLHYVDIVAKYRFARTVQCRPAAKSETSACLMDTGLWLACRESRAVLIRQLQKRGLLLPDAPPNPNQVRWLKAPVQDPIFVSAHQDLFCFRLSEWWKSQRLWAQFNFFLGQYLVHNLAFELDSSWGKREIYWPAFNIALESLDQQRVWGNISLSIIDKNVLWHRNDSIHDITYADCDNEYTIVGWENLCSCNQKRVKTGARAFRRLIKPSSDVDNLFTSHYRMMDSHYKLESKVKVLVRRDNEVQPCQKCQSRREKKEALRNEHTRRINDFARALHGQE